LSTSNNMFLSCTPLEALSTLKNCVKMVVIIPTFLSAFYLTGSCIMFLKQCGFNDFPTKISTLLLLQSVFSCCNNVISVLSGGQLLLTFTCALTLTTQLAFHTRPMRIDIHKYRYSCNSNYQYKQVSTTLCSKYMTLLSFHPLLMCGVTVYSKRSCYTIFS
jgi:hypothetical protein